MTGPLIAWAVEALVASAALMALVLLARGPVRRAFGAQVAYALWALPALRLLLPPLPPAWREQAAMPITRAGEAMTVMILPPATQAAAEPAAAVPWPAIALGAWAVGALAFFAIHLVRHRRFCRRVLAHGRDMGEIDGVRVVESDAANGPLAFGTLTRVVAFPRDFAERYDAEERELALLHELGHHRARDLWANWAALAVLALHWFDPLAWRAFRAFRCDQELANDARVLAGRGRADRHIYACAIVKAAHGGHVSAACHLHTIADLKGRLRMLSRTRPSRRRVAAGVAAVVGLVSTGLALTASGTRAAAAVTEKIGDAVGVDLAAQAAPAETSAPAETPAPAAAATPTVVMVPRARSASRPVHRVVVSKNGETHVYEGREAEAYMAAHPMPVPPAPLSIPRIAANVPPMPPMPPMGAMPPVPPMPPMEATTLSRDGKTYRVFTGPVGAQGFTMMAPPAVMHRACADGKDGGPRNFVLQREEGGRPVMIVCQNRVQAAAAEGARRGQEIAQNAQLRAEVARRNATGARVNAYSSIRTARASILADRNLSDEQRRGALAGLSEAEAELRSSAD